jgi:hypothetical protein
MADVVDVIDVRDLRDARPGDLLVRGDLVAGTVIAGRPGELRAHLDGLPDRLSRWAWDLDKIACNRGTVPVLPKMARVLDEYGIEAGDRFHLMREVR